MVYFVQEGDDGPIKIGVANDPFARLRECQVGNPRELNLLGVYVGGYPEERMLHRRFAAGRIRGEWFRPDTPGLQAVIDGSDRGEEWPLDSRIFELMDSPRLALVESAGLQEELEDLAA